MKSPIGILILVACTMIIPPPAQAQTPSLDIGDSAPPLRIRAWLKGVPVQQFEKGTVYVLEFWATWCRPCKAAMPRLSRLAAEYDHEVVFIGVDVYEKETTSIAKIQGFVDSMGDRMAYRVATEDGNRMETGWIEAAGEDRGIPRSFVIDASGRLAWIGHPSELETVLPKIVAGTWDLQGALARRNSDKYLRQLDDSLCYEFARFRTSAGEEKPGYSDSVLHLVHEFVRDEPGLKYAPRIAYSTFAALLHTDTSQALVYGNQLLATATYEYDPPYYVVTDVLRTYAGKIKIPVEIYRLGVRAFQEQIDHFPYPELIDQSIIYRTMADWDRRAGDNDKAAEAEQKAIAAKPAVSARKIR